MKRRITHNRLLARYLRWMDRIREHRQMARITEAQWLMYLENQEYRANHYYESKGWRG